MCGVYIDDILDNKEHFNFNLIGFIVFIYLIV